MGTPRLEHKFLYRYMYLSVATLAQASQMAHTSGSVDQHADLVPGEDPRLCDLHLSSHEHSYLRAFPHIRQFLMLDLQAQKREAQMMKKREAQILAFRNRYVMRRMFDRLGQAIVFLSFWIIGGAAAWS